MIRKILFVAAVVLAAAPAFAQKMHRSEVSVSYGFVPTTGWVDTYSDLLTNSNSDIDSWGAVTVGYNFRLLKSFSVGAQIVYASNDQKIKRTGVRIDNRYWSLMPNVKWGWLNLRVVSFYSRVGAGVAFCKAKTGDNSDTATKFAFQVSPIGVEVGGRLAAYAEAGIGVSGCVLVGARYRF